MIADGWQQVETKADASPIVCYNTSCPYNNGNCTCQDTCPKYFDKPYTITTSNHSEVD